MRNYSLLAYQGVNIRDINTIHQSINSKSTKDLFRALYHAATFNNAKVLTRRFLGMIKTYERRQRLYEFSRKLN